MTIKYDQQSGLVPAIIQDSKTKNVLMLGYMNEAAFQKTLTEKKVTFYSRSKQRLWTKGEESGHFLELVSVKNDCDQDALLIEAIPHGPTCHKGTDTCWAGSNINNYGFLSQLEAVIEQRKNAGEKSSYVASLFEKGMNKIAQKVGEEAVELVIEAKDNDEGLFLNESADLVFHFLILLSAKGYNLNDVVRILESRHQ